MHTGDVVLGRIDGQSGEVFRAVGDTVNVASRLESAAEPDSILMSADTHRMVEGFVVAESAGEQRLKGKSKAVEAFVLAGLIEGVDRFSARASSGLTPWVGRSEQLDQLRDARRQSTDGMVRIAAISGEAGIGKSRLLSEFREQVLDRSVVVLQGHCAADGTSVPFQPFIEVIRRSFRIGDARDAEVINARLREGLAILGLAEAGHEPYLTNLLTGTRDKRLADIDGERLGRGTIEAIQECLKARCRSSRTVLIIEDLHWIDSQSELLLSWLADTPDEFPLLVLCTFRPSYAGTWLSAERAFSLELSALGTNDMAALICSRLDVAALSPDLESALMERAGGNPLFGEEIATYVKVADRIQVAAGVASIASGIEGIGVPDTLSNLLLNRVDRLDDEVRSVLSIASVVGRRFEADVVCDVAGVNGKIVKCLDILKDQELVFSEPRAGSFYRFKHALIQDAVYGRLLSKEREGLHNAIAEALEERHKGVEAGVADELAHHFGKSGEVEKTIHYLWMAGRKSLDVFAIEAAGARFTEALALAEANPDSLSVRPGTL